MLRNEFGLLNSDPDWLDRPAMMSIARSTPEVLKKLNKLSRPFNFMLCPLVENVAGYPAGIDRDRFTLVTPFNKDRDSWMKSDFVNIYDGEHFSLSLEQTPKLDKVIPKTFGYILRHYLLHPEHKSLAPDGSPCVSNTRGVLQRMHVIATRLRFIGKETDRKWDEGGDLSLLTFKAAHFEEEGGVQKSDPTFIDLLAAQPIKAVARAAEVDRNTVKKVLRGEPVRRSTLLRIAAAVRRLLDRVEH
jgi:hypothetical protein